MNDSDDDDDENDEPDSPKGSITNSTTNPWKRTGKFRKSFIHI